MKSRKRLWLIVAAALAAWCWLLYELQERYFEQRLSAKIALYRGGSLRLEDYLPPPLPAGTPDAWAAVEAAIQRLGWPPRGGLDFVSDPKFSPPAGLQEIRSVLDSRELTGQPLTAEDRALLRDRLAPFSSILADLEQPLREIEEARFAGDYGGLAPEIREWPNVVGVLQIAKLIRARGELAVAEGRCADGADDAAGSYRLAYWLASGSVPITSSAGARRIAEEAGLLVQSLLEGCETDSSMRARIRTEARRSDPARLITQAIRAQRADTFSWVLRPESWIDRRDGKDGKKPNPWFVGAPGWKSWLFWNAEVLLEKYAESEAIYAQPACRRREAEARLDVLGIPRAAVVMKVLYSSSVEMYDARDRWLASLDLLDIALGLEDFHDQHGSYPATLADAGLGLEQRIDPFSGKPYLYRREGSGYRLYSVWLNFIDDGGIRIASNKGGVDRQLGDGLWRIGR